MACTLPPSEQPAGVLRDKSALVWYLAIPCLGVMSLSCLLAGWFPVGFSIVTVFLFAGPHNWLEARYMLTRMPGRWGALRSYFLTALTGVLGLTAAFASLPWLASEFHWSDSDWLVAVAAWNTTLIAWVTALVLLRSRQHPRRQWDGIVPAACLLIAINWLLPTAWSLSLVYLHPLMALWFLDRELGQKQPAWRRTWRLCLPLIPIGLTILWIRLGTAPDLASDDVLTRQISLHVGAGIVRHASTHFLVSAHTFLEMLHYGVWIVAIPLVSLKTWPWNMEGVPLARRSPTWKWFVTVLLAGGAVVMIVLWGAFLADYSTTRYIYFTVAMLHVLAEIPFLLRLL